MDCSCIAYFAGCYDSAPFSFGMTTPFDAKKGKQLSMLNPTGSALQCKKDSQGSVELLLSAPKTAEMLQQQGNSYI